MTMRGVNVLLEDLSTASAYSLETQGEHRIECIHVPINIFLYFSMSFSENTLRTWAQRCFLDNRFTIRLPSSPKNLHLQGQKLFQHGLQASQLYLIFFGKAL